MPVAAPRTGVIRVGVLARTIAPVPVEEVIEMLGVAPPVEARGEDAVTEVTGIAGVSQVGIPKAKVRTWPSVPVEASSTRPVPRVEANVILGLLPPVEARGREAVTDATVPVPGTADEAAHVGLPPNIANTWPSAQGVTVINSFNESVATTDDWLNEEVSTPSRLIPSTVLAIYSHTHILLAPHSHGCGAFVIYK